MTEADDGVALRRDPLWVRRAHRLEPGGFKTVQLNAAGWSALVGTGLVAGALTALVGAVRLRLALPLGVLAVWAAALVADHVRWRNGTTAMGFGWLDAERGAAIVAELERRGIAATYEERVYDDEDGTRDVQHTLVCRNADAETVAALAHAARAEER